MPKSERKSLSQRFNKLAQATQNILELARAGRLTSPETSSFEVVHTERTYRLRRYQTAASDTASSERARSGPLLLIPPLMLTAEIYDMAPDVSVVSALLRDGVDVWVVDFGAPEREQGGLERTLDDHVSAIDDAIDRVRAATSASVHLAGYSQGGMFAYQVAAYRKSEGIASVITFGSPVNLHRSVPGVSDAIIERVVRGALPLLEVPMDLLPGIPGVVTSTAFRLLSVRKEISQLAEFAQKLHDRAALERRESKRLFLRGEGFVAWPGPALRRFVEDVIVDNRMATGGLVINGRAVSLADIRVPVLCFIGTKDELARPAAVRGIRRVAAFAEIHEVVLRAGHFGLVIGTMAQRETWPAVGDWLRWQSGHGPRPVVLAPPPQGDDDEVSVEALRKDDDDLDRTNVNVDFDLFIDVAKRGLHALREDFEDVARHWATSADNARWQVARLQKLQRLTATSKVSLGRALSERARYHANETLILWRERAVSTADANRRVDNVVRGLIARGVTKGERVAIVMNGRPSYLSALCALNRMGAVAVLVDVTSSPESIRLMVAAAEATRIVTDPQLAPLCAKLPVTEVMVLGGTKEPTRQLPAGVTDLEAIDPSTIALPTWYEVDPGRAADLAIMLAAVDAHGRPTLARITNLRWAFSAYGAAAACTLTPQDTVYSTLPLHHAAGTMVAAGAAVVGGSRLALGRPAFDPESFWREIRRTGATVVFYAGEMCRALVDAPVRAGDTSHAVRLFAGSGMRADVWSRLAVRFGRVGVFEFYASTETNAVLANAKGTKIGSVGQALPGSAPLAVVRLDLGSRSIFRDESGRGTAVAVDEIGLLISKFDPQLGTHPASSRLLRGVFEADDCWFSTGALMRIDHQGDHWYVDRLREVGVVDNRLVSPRLVEDALYAVRGVTAAAARIDPDTNVVHAAVAASAELEEASLVRAARTLQPSHRPAEVLIFDTLPMSDGYRYRMPEDAEKPRLRQPIS